MKPKTKKLQLAQMSNKSSLLADMGKVTIPEKGWVNAVRTSIGMSMRQMAKRMQKSISTVQKLEKSESEGRITLRSLREAAQALDMKLVYGLIPRTGTLEEVVETRAKKLAMEIVKRTNTTMKLEDQSVSDMRLKEEIDEISQDLIREMPRKLWD